MDSLGYIGHATTLIRLDGTAVLTDPFLRGWMGPLRRQAAAPSPEVAKIPNAVLISHVHRDHLDVRSLRRLRPSTPLIVPRGARKWALRGGAEDVREIGIGETISLGTVDVTAVWAMHNAHRDRTWGERIQPLGYLLKSRDRTVYFAGDTDLFPEMSEFGAVDLAVLPVWGWGWSIGEGHLDPERAVRALEMIQPRIAVPIHWGTFFPIGMRRLRPEPLTQPPLEFARLASRLAPEVEVRVLAPGSVTELDH